MFIVKSTFSTTLQQKNLTCMTRVYYHFPMKNYSTFLGAASMIFWSKLAMIVPVDKPSNLLPLSIFAWDVFHSSHGLRKGSKLDAFSILTWFEYVQVQISVSKYLTKHTWSPYNRNHLLIEGSLEVKLPTIWTDEKQRWKGSERRERLEERRVEEKESEERRCRCAKR